MQLQSTGFRIIGVYCRRLLICDRYTGRRADEIRKTARRLQRPGGFSRPDMDHKGSRHIQKTWP